MILGTMKQPEIVTFLKSLGFTNLKLLNHKDTTYTYSFDDLDVRALKSQVGSPTVAGGGKVAVYEIPGTAKIGVSTSNNAVRFIDLTPASTNVSDAHLGEVDLPPALEAAYLRASGNQSFRIPFCKKLWEHFNKEKFNSRLTMPRLLVGDSPPEGVDSKARGVYYGGPGFRNKALYMASFMFNARIKFFIEVFLHEMCHQAVWTLDKVPVQAEGGHGPEWKAWMVRVGLDPRRYDPTDDQEYAVGGDRHMKISLHLESYGPLATKAEIKELKPLPSSIQKGAAYFQYKGRIFKGESDGKHFRGRNIHSPFQYVVFDKPKSGPFQLYSK